uniref:Uncharacterized protein n=1 Tax=Photinus pyralis TaxID=7054 RepID=A0A1Y1MCQ9_PHOPY
MDIVWARDPIEGYILGQISELLPDGTEVEPLDPKYPKRVCAFSEIHQTGDYNKEYEDNCEMMYLNESTLLNNVKRMYYKNRIYVCNTFYSTTCTLTVIFIDLCCKHINCCKSLQRNFFTVFTRSHPEVQRQITRSRTSTCFCNCRQSVSRHASLQTITINYRLGRIGSRKDRIYETFVTFSLQFQYRFR